MATFVKFEVLSEHLAEKVHDFSATGDLLKVFLTNTAPTASTNTVRADLTAGEPAGVNNYTTGGDDAQNDTSRSGAITSVTGVDIVFSASGGTIGPFTYAVLYNDTPTSPADPLIGYWVYPSEVTLQDGETFTVDFGASMFTVT